MYVKYGIFYDEFEVVRHYSTSTKGKHGYYVTAIPTRMSGAPVGSCLPEVVEHGPYESVEDAMIEGLKQSGNPLILEGRKLVVTFGAWEDSHGDD